MFASLARAFGAGTRRPARWPGLRLEGLEVRANPGGRPGMTGDVILGQVALVGAARAAEPLNPHEGVDCFGGRGGMSGEFLEAVAAEFD